MSYSKKYIYLDSAATASSAKFDVTDEFANPNSIHDAGRDSYIVLEDAREYIAKSIGAKRPSEIIFTSGATESNNTAIFGIARAALDNKGIRQKALLGQVTPRVIISAIEHESVELPALELKNEGFDVVYCPVDKNGFVDIDAFKNLLTSDTVLVSVQSANTEIGVIQDLKTIIDIAHSQGVFVHSDCVGSFGRIPLNVSELGVDCISFAGHKIGTAKGIGGLYLKSGIKCKPLLYGSGQENGVRGGTQNVAMAASMKKATKYAMKNMEAQNEKFLNLRKYLIERLIDFKEIKFSVDINNYGDKILPNIVHLLYENITSESLILHYGKYNISLSGGPACSARDKEPSHVLKSINVPKNLIDGALRLSFSDYTCQSDLEVFIKATKELYEH